MKQLAYILCAGMVLLASCSKIVNKKPAERPVLTVGVLAVDQLEGTPSQAYVGEIRAAQEVPMYYTLGGEVKAIYVKNGQQVRKGQAIADIDSTQAYSLYQTAKAILQQAEDGYQRLQQVHEKGVVSDVRWVEMQTDLEKARQNEILARKTLQDCHLKAPIDGVVSGMDVLAGQHLLPSQAICHIMGLQNVEVSFSVPEQDVANIAIGSSVMVDVPAIEQKIAGKISEKEMVANPVAHTYTIRASLQEKGPLPGMVAKVHITSADNKGIIIPGHCVQTTPQGPCVWVAENGKAVRRQITIEGYQANGIAVASGLSLQDSLIVSGYQKLYSGAEIETTNE